jgi:hypothetical protein
MNDYKPPLRPFYPQDPTTKTLTARSWNLTEDGQAVKYAFKFELEYTGDTQEVLKAVVRNLMENMYLEGYFEGRKNCS